MNTNLLIGVGGTGAKVVEAALFAFASGLGPEAVTVGFVDQDESNGNVERARSLLGALTAFRARWSGQHAGFDWTAAEGAMEFGRVVVSAMQPELWCPHSEQGTTLSSIFHAEALEHEDPALKALMDLLYADDASEQGMDLGVGYRGRPHIGAAAMLSRLTDRDNAFARALQDVLNRARSGQEVRIFLIGSVFGGTGAAGFPTLARALRRAAGDAAGAIRIGGALMLPYFGFAAPEDDQANVARTEDLLRNSQAALKYYHLLFQQEQIFDELYLTGWSPDFQLGYHSPGSASQANPPLPPELIGAMSAVRFFDEGRTIDTASTNATYISSRSAPDALGWDDLPAASRDGRAETREKIGQMLRFCAFWRDTARPELDRKVGLFGSRSPWFKRQGVDKVPFDQPDIQQALASLDGLVERLLTWAAALQAYATTPAFGSPAVRRFELWDLGGLVRSFTPVVDPAKPQDPRLVLKPRGEAGRVEAYDRIITVSSGQTAPQAAAPPTQDVLNEAINTTPLTGGHRGLGRLVAAIHAGATLRRPLAG